MIFALRMIAFVIFAFLSISLGLAGADLLLRGELLASLGVLLLSTGFFAVAGKLLGDPPKGG